MQLSAVHRRRFYLEIVGRRRFKIQRAFEQDGYRVAVPEWLQDTAPAEGSPEAAELPGLAKEVLELTAKLTESLRSALVLRCSRPAPAAHPPSAPAVLSHHGVSACPCDEPTSWWFLRTARLCSALHNASDTALIH